MFDSRQLQTLQQHATFIVHTQSGDQFGVFLENKTLICNDNHGKVQEKMSGGERWRGERDGEIWPKPQLTRK